jgi:hypothetical protein
MDAWMHGYNIEMIPGKHYFSITYGLWMDASMHPCIHASMHPCIHASMDAL